MNSRWLALPAILSFLCLSCATPPNEKIKNSSDRSVLRLRIADGPEISRVAGSFQNPYAVPDFLIFKSDREFVVLAVDIESRSGGEKLRLESLDAGKSGASYVAKPDFIDWWTKDGGIDGKDQSWKRMVEKTYLPNTSFTAQRGERSYYCVLMGKKPLSRPATIRALFSINGEQREFELSYE